MRLSEDKLKRLVAVAKMYYEEEESQAEIAKKIQVSRPMVSKLLAEAKELGIVTIHIREAASFRQILAEQLEERFSVRKIHVLPSEKNDERTDNALVIAAFDRLAAEMKGGGNLGLGWGSLIGRMVDYLETKGSEKLLSGTVCPLIGSAAASYRSYHTNELVRIFAKKTGMEPAYIYAPAIAESHGEKEVYENTDSFLQVREMWKDLYAAVINISNYPSSPDMATAFRFGGRLTDAGAVGHMVSHFYDREGRFISEENDCTLRISTEELRRVRHVIAVCGSGVKSASVVGAMATGLITELYINEELASELVNGYICN